MEHKIFLARQPIMDRSGAVTAHELLFRESAANAATIHDGFGSTVAVVERALSAFGIELILGSADGFLNCTDEFLFSDLLDVLPACQFVLEVLEDAQLTPELARRCDALRQRGFRIALDDVRAITPEVEAFIPHVDIVKLDWPYLAPDQALQLIAYCKRAGRLVLAEKVEHREEHEVALQAGCDLFQGYYFSKPQMFCATSVPPYFGSVLTVLQLLTQEASDAEVERALRHAPELVVHLLHLADSSDRSRARDTHISSVRQALLAVGSRHLMRWCCILLYGIKDGLAPEVDPLIRMVDQRAGFMELAAKELMPDSVDLQQSAYLAGMLSLVHVPHGIDANSFLARLPVSTSIRDAIVEHAGSLGFLLNIAESLEKGNYNAALEQGREFGAGFHTRLSLLAHWCGIAPSCDSHRQMPAV